MFDHEVSRSRAEAEHPLQLRMMNGRSKREEAGEGGVIRWAMPVCTAQSHAHLPSRGSGRGPTSIEGCCCPLGNCEEGAFGTDLALKPLVGAIFRLHNFQLRLKKLSVTVATIDGRFM